jgi:hypothetical protein
MNVKSETLQKSLSMLQTNYVSQISCCARNVLKLIGLGYVLNTSKKVSKWRLLFAENPSSQKNIIALFTLQY